MKKYNFDEIIDRQHTNSLNTDGFRGYIFNAGPEKKFKFKDEDFVRMWVADMEFATAEPIRNALKNRIDKKIFGYTEVYEDGYFKAFIKWCKEKYDWEFKKEELVFSPGVIPALYQIIEDIVKPDEKVLILSPSYGFFKHACTYNNVELVQSNLNIDNSEYSINFEDFIQKAKDSKVKLFILCNPHNPTGHVWTEKELTKLAEIIEKNNLWVISDEIHCDIVRVGVMHIPLGKIMPKYKKLITCMSASKTFNIAGLQFSNIIIREENERLKFKMRDKLVGFKNPLSIVAHQAAYEESEEWLEELKIYLDNNFLYLKEFLNNSIPNIKFEIPKATYLAWVNLNGIVPEKYLDDLPSLFADNGLLLEGGNSLFVGNARGYIRLNLAMPRSIIKKGLECLKSTLEKINN